MGALVLAGEPRPMVIPGLLAPFVEILDAELGEVRTLLAWKRVRQTSTGLYAMLQDTGILALRRKQVLNAVAAFRNRHQMWPINDEVQDWLVAAKLIADDGNPNYVRPRLTELSRGWHELRVTQVDGRRVTEKIFRPCDVLVAGPSRKNKHGRGVTTWEVREFGEAA